MRNGPYILIVAPENYPGMKYRGRYVYEHIFNYWEKTGTIPPKGFEIHHIDGNHHNNKIENLRLVTSKEHRKIHAVLKRKPDVLFKCGYCQKYCITKNNNYNQYMRKSKFGKIFCSQRCGRFHQMKMEKNKFQGSLTGKT